MRPLNRRRTPKERGHLAGAISLMFTTLVYFSLLGMTLQAILASSATSLLIGMAVAIAVERYGRRRD